MELPVFTLKHALDNSYRNFHAKGMEYICLKRSPKLTVKLYVFDGDVSKLPEVVNPHDHRYPFDTAVVAGSMQNMLYRPGESGEVFQTFDYMTPLNGGNGFTWREERALEEYNRQTLHRGQSYLMDAAGIHTIRMLEDQTVLVLRQYEDVVPLDQPTLTFTHEKEPPSLSGLYERWTEGELVDRLKDIEGRTGLNLLALMRR